MKRNRQDNDLTPRIEILRKKQLIGIDMEMSLMNNKTGQLWGQFSPRIKEIENRVCEDKISMQVYSSDYYSNVNPDKNFIKWAAVEVDRIQNVPEGMKTFTLVGGMYAVFDYKGSSLDNSIYQYIFSEWIPRSRYCIDDRPHFELLGSKYKNNDQNSEEEIWIPIQKKSDS